MVVFRAKPQHKRDHQANWLSQDRNSQTDRLCSEGRMAVLHSEHPRSARTPAAIAVSRQQSGGNRTPINNEQYFMLTAFYVKQYFMLCNILWSTIYYGQLFFMSRKILRLTKFHVKQYSLYSNILQHQNLMFLYIGLLCCLRINYFKAYNVF